MSDHASRLAKFIRSYQLADAFLLTYAVGAFALAVSFLAAPDLFRSVQSFTVAFDLASPWVWALALHIPAVWIGVAIWLDRRAAMIPCQMVAVVFTAFGFCAVPAHGIPSVVIVYSILGILASLTGLLAWDVGSARSVHNHDQP